MATFITRLWHHAAAGVRLAVKDLIDHGRPADHGGQPRRRRCCGARRARRAVHGRRRVPQE